MTHNDLLGFNKNAWFKCKRFIDLKSYSLAFINNTDTWIIDIVISVPKAMFNLIKSWSKNFLHTFYNYVHIFFIFPHIFLQLWKTTISWISFKMSVIGADGAQVPWGGC